MCLIKSFEGMNGYKDWESVRDVISYLKCFWHGLESCEIPCGKYQQNLEGSTVMARNMNRK